MTHRILIVDDDPVYREIVTAALATLPNIELLHAENGAAALRLLDKHQDKICLLICDLHMPEKDGIELIGEFGLRRVGLPLIIVSSAERYIFNAAGVLASRTHLNLIGMLAKPVDLVALTKLIKTALNMRLAA